MEHCHSHLHIILGVSCAAGSLFIRLLPVSVTKNLCSATHDSFHFVTLCSLFSDLFFLLLHLCFVRFSPTLSDVRGDMGIARVLCIFLFSVSNTYVVYGIRLSADNFRHLAATMKE